MSTAKLLQTPSIIEIIGSTIRINHPNTKGNAATFLRSQSAAAATSLTVGDNNGFINTDYLVIGPIGYPQTEATNITSSVSRGSTLAVTATVFAHEFQTPVTRIIERTIKIYGSATNGGSLTLIASCPSNGFPIQWDKPFTEFNFITSDTVYAYYACKFSDTVTDSTVSTYIPSTGLPYNSIEPFITQAMDVTNSVIDDDKITRESLVRFANDCQLTIQQFKYQDPVTGNYRQKDWSFEVIRDTSSITAVLNQNTYALSALTAAFKYPNSDKGIISVQLGTQKPMLKIAVDEMDDLLRLMPKDSVATQPSVGATSLVINDTADFASSGSILVGSDTVTYTAKTTTTFTGIPASGTGSITSAYSTGAPVWQNAQAGLPTRYCIFNGSLVFDKPISADYVPQKIKIRYFSMLTRLTGLNDITTVPFTNIFYPYLAYRLSQRKGMGDEAKSFYDDFNTQLLNNALADYIPTTDEFIYHAYADSPNAMRDTDAENSYFTYP